MAGFARGVESKGGKPPGNSQKNRILFDNRLGRRYLYITGGQVSEKTASLFHRRFFLIFVRVILSVALFPPIYVRSAFLRNVPQTFRQPDGTKLSLLASGDEFYNWLHDKDNFTIIQDSSTGYYVYAIKTGDGDLAPSSYIVGRSDPKILGLEPGLLKSPEIIKSRRAAMFENSAPPGGEPAPRSGTINNLVIFIRFYGEAEFTNPVSNYQASFNSGANSLKSYFWEASYNMLTIDTTFYPVPGAMVVSHQDIYPRGFYQSFDAFNNPLGYSNESQRVQREHNLLTNAVYAVSFQIPAGLNIDAYNDGKVDSVCFIVSGYPAAGNATLWPHRSQLTSYSVSINGKRVYDYNFQLNESAGPTPSVLVHEMGHSLGAPDLYHYSGVLHPVGNWDVMATDNQAVPPPHMGAYLKSKYMGWISSIPEIATAGTYLLHPIASSTNNCYLIRSPNSTSERFIVEYRRKKGTFESPLPGEGLLVYRINLNGGGNASGPPDEVYIYRPNGTPTSDGDLNNAAFSSNAGRTALNDTSNPPDFLSNGNPGGLNISNVGAIGETISFKVNFVPTIAALTPLPAPPQAAGTPITWTATASGGIAPLQYKFLLSAGGEWAVARDYSVANSWTWTPAQAGPYAVQVWVRSAGSTADYESAKASGSFNITGSTLSLKSLAPSPAPPQGVGTPITWTVTAAGGITPLQNKFYLYNASTGWTIARDYGTSNAWTWTPTQPGQYAVQAWVRNSGSTAIYDAWKGSGYFDITGTAPMVTSLIPSPAPPQVAGTSMTWTATVAGGVAPLLYKFWLYNAASGWTMIRDFDTSNTWNWVPPQPGQYAVQVWVRNAGSTGDYDGWKGSGYFNITGTALSVQTLTPSPALPQSVGTAITWTASASGGTAPLQYKFWLYSSSSGWVIAQDFSASNTWTWTSALPGQYAVQVWVRNAGSTATYDAWKGSGYFDITGTSLSVTSLTPSPGLPQSVGTPINWTATATGGIAPLQYKFYLYNASTGWLVAQDYSSSNTWTWTPAQAGQYAIQVWVRNAGSSANYDAWRGSGYFDIAARIF